MKKSSHIVEFVEDYLAFKRDLGFQLKIEGQQLLGFARYLEQLGQGDTVTTELALRWAKLPEGGASIYWARRLDIVRRFAKYRALFDPDTEIPPEGLLGPSYRRPAPHIYSEAEIAALLGAAAKLRPRKGLRPHTYYTLLGLLACSGLRISEALRLTRNDVDLRIGALMIRETKFHKSRLVPLHQSAVKALRSYAARRDRYHRLAIPQEFFLNSAGTPLKYSTVNATFGKLREKLGWTKGKRKRLPTIRDMRHTFACRRLLCWYEEGVDVNNKIASLATYLGHVKVSNTYWYLTAVPELLAVASVRFEQMGSMTSGGKL
jgi:integrase